MASFTEQAILKVVDKSSPQIRKINAELKKLFATAKSLKSINIAFKINTGDINKATAALGKLNAASRKLGAQSSISLAKASKAQQQHNQHVIAAIANQKKLQQAQRVTQSGVPRVTQRSRAQPWGTSPGRPPPTQPRPVPGGSGGRGGRTPTQAGLAGFAGGFGYGLSRLGESFGAVSLAGFAAARALRAIASAGYTADRMQLAVETLSSKAQQEAFAQRDAAAGPVKGALKHKKTEFDYARATLLGDVGNSDDIINAGRTALKSLEAQRERALRSDVLTRHMFENIVPGQYARNPKMTQEESLEDLKAFVQATGLTTSEIFRPQTREQRAAGAIPELSEDFKRATEGFRLAQIADPSIKGNMLKTAMANVKSLGYSMTSEAIAEALITMGTRGQRAMNEAFRAYLLGTGANDVKKVNETLASELNLFEPGTVKRNAPTKNFPKGSVKAGTGIARKFYDAEGQEVDIGTRPGEYWRAAYEAKGGIREAVIKRNIEAAQGAARRGGGNKAAIEAAGKAAAAKVPTESDIAEYLHTHLSGANRSAIQGIIDAILGKNITKSALGQAETAPTAAEVNDIMEKKWSVAADNVTTAWTEAAGKVMTGIADKLDLNGFLQGLSTKISENPYTSMAISAFGGLVAVGLAAAVTSVLVTPFTTLTTAGTTLIESAGALMRAAMALGGDAVLGGGAAGAGAGKKTLEYGKAVARWIAKNPGRTMGAGVLAAILAEIYSATPDEAAAARKNLEDKERASAIQRQIASNDALLKIFADSEKKSTATQEAIDRAVAENTALKAELRKLTEKPPATSATETEAGEVTPQTQTQIVEVATAAAVKAIADQQAKTPAPALTPPASTLTPANVTLLSTLMPQLTQTSQSISLSVKGLTDAGTTFATTFGTAVTNLKTAGDAATTTLRNAAPSIGKSLGDAAAAAIRNAVANINVNATVKEPGANKAPRPASN